MKKGLLVLWLICCCSIVKAGYKETATALIQRVLPAQAAAFSVEIIPAENGNDVFEIASSGNKVVLRGNTPVSVASALNWYLKYYCHCQLSWNGDNLRLPAALPVVTAKVHIVTPYEHRVYLNYCTFSYSMAWWDWARWQREIDWMAMHGINMPLAITGQEAVWQNTLRRFKMNDKEIRSFLVGPAFFAWQWMTNIESWAGPLPQGWIDHSIVLGKQILAREREMGMTPVLQGFTGYIPIALKQKFPAADITVKPFWLRYFPPGTAQLDPLDPLFSQMGKAFLEEQAKLFGSNHYYAGDPFHEGEPPKQYKGYLEEVGKALYDVTKSVDTAATIVMQSWSIREAIAKGIPTEKLLVLDLNGSKWKGTHAFWGSSWVSGIIQNYGGKTEMGGSIDMILQQQAAANHDTAWKHISGIGIFPEAIEHNPVIFEAASEMAWRRSAPVTSDWIKSYSYARYGSADVHTQTAWDVLLNTVYKAKHIDISRESPVVARPALKVNGASPNGGLNTEKNYRFADLWAAPAAMLSADRALHQLPAYQYDLVDMLRQCLGDLAIPVQQQVSRAYLAGDKDSFRIATTEFLSLIDDMDELLGTNEHFLLGKWIADARRCGNTAAEKALYEQNARWLVTVWGPYDKDAMLFDYSSRQWSGLLKQFYRKRWADYFSFLQAELKRTTGRYVETDAINHRFKRPSNEANDFYKRLSKWEYAWCNQQDSFPATTRGDAYTIAARLYAKWQPVAQRIYTTR